MENRDQRRRGAGDASAENAKVEEHLRYGSPMQPLGDGKLWAYVRQLRIFAIWRKKKNRNKSAAQTKTSFLFWFWS